MYLIYQFKSIMSNLKRIKSEILIQFKYFVILRTFLIKHKFEKLIKN